MITTRHSDGLATTAARLRRLRMATAVAAAFALTQAAFADARPQLTAGAGAGSQHALTARANSTAVACPCNAGLPVGTIGAADVPATPSQAQRPGPLGPVGVRRTNNTAVPCPCNAGLPIGAGTAAYAPTAHPHVQRQGPGGPVGRLAAPPAVASPEVTASDGFDWMDAAAGAGAMAVLGGLVIAAGRVRSRPLPG